MPKSIRGKLFLAYVVVSLLVAAAIAQNMYFRYQSRFDIVKKQQKDHALLVGCILGGYIEEISAMQKVTALNSIEDNRNLKVAQTLKSANQIDDLIICDNRGKTIRTTYPETGHPSLNTINFSKNITLGELQEWKGQRGFPLISKFNIQQRKYLLISFITENELSALLPKTLIEENIEMSDKTGRIIFSQKNTIGKQLTKLPSKELTNFYNENGLLISHYPIKGLEADVIISEPYSKAMEPAQRTLLMSIYTFVPLLFIVFLIGMFATNRIIGPLTELSKKAKSMNWHLNDKIITGSHTDEIRVLADSLEELRQNIQINISELERTNSNLGLIEDIFVDIHDTVSVKERAVKIAELAVKVSSADCGVLTLVDLKKNKIFMKTNYQTPDAVFNDINSLKELSKKNIRKTIINDCLSNPATRFLGKEGIASAAIFKLGIGHNLSAVLELFSNRKNNFSKSNLKFIEHIIRPSALALNNAILHRNQAYAQKYTETILENHPYATSVVSYPELKIVKANQAFNDLFGDKEVIHEGIYGLHSGFDKKRVQKAITEVEKTQRPFFIKEIKAGFREAAWVNLCIIPILDNKNILNLIITIDDCTRELSMRRKLQELLKKQSGHSQELETVISSLQCGLLISGKENVTNCNDRFLEILEINENINNQALMKLDKCVELRSIDGTFVKLIDQPHRRILREPYIQGVYIAVTTKGNQKYISINGAALKDSEGNSRGGIFTIEDITEFMKIQDKLKDSLFKKKEWQEKLKLLNKASVELSKAYDIDKVLEITGKSAMELTDSNLASAYITDETQKKVQNYFIGMPEDYPHSCKSDKSKFEVCFHGCLYSKCLREGKPQIINDIESYAEKKDLPHGHVPLKGLLVLPITSPKGKVVGLVYVSDKKNNQKYTVEDKNIVHSLAVHASAAIENAKNYQREHKIASVLQKSLLPVLPTLPNVEFDYAYEAATSGVLVGGDFFDIMELGEGKIGIVIADVAGKGIEAASVTSTVKNTLRAFTHENLSPGDILTRTNKSLYNQGIPSFVTAVFGILDCNVGKLAYSCAGHHPPVLYKGRLGNAIFLQKGSCPLGVLPDEIYEDFTADFNPSDTLLLYTDGLVEARNKDDFFGEKRLLDCVLKYCHQKRPVANIIKEVEEFAKSDFKDDIAVLSVKLMEFGKERTQLNLRLGRLFNN